MKPAAEFMGYNNAMLVDSRDEILKGKTYKDSSLVVVTLTRGERKVKCKCGQEYIFDLGIHFEVARPCKRRCNDVRSSDTSRERDGSNACYAYVLRRERGPEPEVPY